MKNLLTASLILCSLNTFAVAIGDEAADDSCFGTSYQKNAFMCGISTTFSLPVLIVADQEIELTPAQAKMMVLSEIESGETTVTKAIADANGTTVEQVQNAALETLH